MHIGFDFDNTIVSYDALFHQIAKEQQLIDDTIPVNKIAVRNHLRDSQREHLWTEMQGYVYGSRMLDARAFPHAINVIKSLKQAGHQLSIVSHKTKFPFLGKPYDLHAAARAWIESYLCDGATPLIQTENIYFELTKDEKINRIATIECDVFVDDLPEIFSTRHFPVKTRKILFDPEAQHNNALLENTHTICSWDMLERVLPC